MDNFPDDKDLNFLARKLFEEEERMLPAFDNRGWADQQPGEVSYFRNCVTVVLSEAETLKKVRLGLACSNAHAKDGKEEISG